MGKRARRGAEGGCNGALSRRQALIAWGFCLPFVLVFGVFLMRQFIAGIPDALMEAARIDGAGELRIFFQIILPQCGPAMATLAILTFLSSWNNFLWPLVAAQTDDMYTLPVALSLYSTGQNATNYSVLLAGAVLIITRSCSCSSSCSATSSKAWR